MNLEQHLYGAPVLSGRLYRELIERARHFHRVSSFDVEQGRYDIALFHLEQAAQLSIKAYMPGELGTSLGSTACTTG